MKFTNVYLSDGDTNEDADAVAQVLDRAAQAEIVKLAEKYDKNIYQAMAVGLAALGLTLGRGLRSMSDLYDCELSDQETVVVHARIQAMIVNELKAIYDRVAGRDN